MRVSGEEQSFWIQIWSRDSRRGTLELEPKLCFTLDEFFSKGEGYTNDLEGFIYLHKSTQYV